MKLWSIMTEAGYLMTEAIDMSASAAYVVDEYDSESFFNKDRCFSQATVFAQSTNCSNWLVKPVFGP